MKKHQIIFIQLVVLLGFLFSTGQICLAEDGLPYGKPTANKEIDKVVPFHLAEKVALMEARKAWGQVAQGPYLEACDDDGDIISYYFIFAIGRSNFPEYPEMLDAVQYGRKVAEGGLSALTDADRLIIENQAKEERSNFDKQTSLAKKTGVKPPLRSAETFAKMLGQDMMIGAKRFGTVVVSARKDYFPNQLTMHYLHPYFYQADLAVEKAKENLSSKSVALGRIYFLGAARGQYLEFSSGEKKVLLNLYSLEAAEPEKVLTRKGNKIAPSKEKQLKIDEEWDKVMKSE